MAETGPRAFVCGHPVAHSRSPLIHRHWLEQYGIAGSYEAIDVAPEAFPAFLGVLAGQGWAGGNVTIPHKEEAATAAAVRDEAAELIGAANTLWFESGRLCAGNTDWSGFAANLDKAVPQWRRGREAIVLGAGGAARGVIHALQKVGYRDIAIVNRTPERALALADRFRGGTKGHRWAALPELVATADLLVNTTSLGMDGAAEPSIDLSGAKDSAIVTDIVYVPLETPLLAAAFARGLATVDGLGMLLHQAAPGFEKWFGRRPEVTPELRNLVVADLGAHT